MRIGVYGDSTQVGVSVYGGTVYPASFPPSRIAQVLLDEKYGAGSHIVTNYGSGGATILSATTGSIYPEGNMADSVAAHGDDIIVANFGLNDAYDPNINANIYKWRYQSLRATVENSGKIFVYETPNPNAASLAHNSAMASYMNAFRNDSPGLKVIDTYSAIAQWYPSFSSHLSDGIHPNQIMYWFIGEFLFKNLDALL